MRAAILLAAALASTACAAAPARLAPSDATLSAVRARPASDEVIYFLLPDRFANGDTANDRGGLKGGPLVTGFDPTHKGFFHGGDLKGLTGKLDYIQSLGASAVWLSPVFANKPVQGAKGQESAGYHGYWVTDFTRVDPHLGTNADFKAFVDAAHARGMKVYMDIIVNHTADVISYAECKDKSCAYKSQADAPWQRRAADGAPINAGFAGVEDASEGNFARLTDPNWAYTVTVPPAERSIKKPDWLNDPLLYHNRGDSFWQGESAVMGDFAGLDDLMTENPRVVNGFIEVFGRWIDEFGIDGFRIDTAKHVDAAFWGKFVPAMEARAAARGIPNFAIFGEVYDDQVDPTLLAWFTRDGHLPSVLDFALRRAVIDSIAGPAGTSRFEKLLIGDSLYRDGEKTARVNPTFISNHDAGRFAGFARIAFPKADDAEILKRTMLANAVMFAMRGVPTVYAGDEQGFAGDGGDQDAREDLFPSKVASYNDNRLLGTAATTASANYDRAHPLYRQLAALSALRRAEPVLRHGTTRLRASSDKPGLLAFSRLSPGEGEVLFAANSSTSPIDVNVSVEPGSERWTSLSGTCPAASRAPGSLHLTIEPLGYIICKASK